MKKIIFLLFSLLIMFFSAGLVFAQLGNWEDNLITGAAETNVYKTYVGAEGTAATIAKYVGSLLYMAPFFGFLFLVRVITAGYEWMTAAGNKEKIGLAQKRIMNATIGVVLFAVLYFLAYFFVSKFAGFTGYSI
jgi:hypothetical protein